MAHDYNIIPASINGGRRNSISTYWTNFQEGNGGGYVVGHSSAGYSSTYYRVVNFLFNSADLAQFSGKTITSIVLRIKVSSGTLGSTSYPYRVRYKYNDVASTSASSDAWASGTADGSAYDDTDLDTWSNGQGSGTTTIAANTTHDFDLGTTLPSYGYVIAGVSGSNAYMVLAEATLIVTTTETQRKLVYNANGGTGAPSTQTAWENPGTSHTFTVSNTTPTRTGFEFVSWNTSADGSGTSKTGGQTISVSSSTTLYAQWNALKSTLNTISAGTIGSSVSVSWTAKGSFSHKLKFTLGSATTSEVTIAAGTNSYTFSIPSSWLNQLPTTTSGTATAMLTTLVDNTSIGTDSKSFSVNVASSVVPSIGTVSATKVNTNPTVSSWDIYLQSYSQVKITANTLTAGTGATLSSVRFTGQNLDYTKSSPSSSENTTSNVITGSGSLTYTVKLTDSRGRTATKTVSISVTAYQPPTVTYLYGWRCNSDGTVNWTTGDSLEVQVRYTYTAVGTNAVTNSLGYKKTTEQYYSTVGTNLASNSVTIFAQHTADLASTYDAQFTISDSLLNSSTLNITISSVVGIAFGLKNDRARFGGAVRQAGLEVDWNTQFDEVVDIVKRRSVAILSSAGWYRVCTYAISSSGNVTGGHGTVVKFNIQKHTSAENHSITLRMASSSNIIWCDESSHSGTQLIDKIRYTYNSTTLYGFVDIHFTGTANRGICVDYDVYESGNDRQTRIDYLKVWTSNNLTAVADAPSGETIVATHTFVSDGFAPNQAIITPNGNLATTGTRLLHEPSSVSLASATWKTIATLTLDVGVYLLVSGVRFASNATGIRRVQISRSADADNQYGIISNQALNAVDGTYTYCNVTYFANITADDTVYYLNAYQNSGSALTTSGRFYAVKIC